MGRSRLFYRNLFAKLVREAQIFAISADVQSAITGFVGQTTVVDQNLPASFGSFLTGSRVDHGITDAWKSRMHRVFPFGFPHESAELPVTSRTSARVQVIG
jgi:hypothetical protein